MTNKAEQPTIAQADRDAAAGYARAQPKFSFLWSESGAIQMGSHDDWEIVQAFARHRTTSLAAQDGLEDNFRDALAAAYVAGATDVHNAWVEGVNGGEPDFGEAGWDYAHSIDLSAIKEQHHD